MKPSIRTLNDIRTYIRKRHELQPMQLHVNVLAFLDSEEKRLSTADPSDPPTNPPLPPGDPGDGNGE